MDQGLQVAIESAYRSYWLHVEHSPELQIALFELISSI